MDHAKAAEAVEAFVARLQGHGAQRDGRRLLPARVRPKRFNSAPCLAPGHSVPQPRLRINARAGGKFQKAHPDQMLRAPAQRRRQALVDICEAMVRIRAPDEANAAGGGFRSSQVHERQIHGRRIHGRRLIGGRGRVGRACPGQRRLTIGCGDKQRRLACKTAALEDQRDGLPVNDKTDALQPRRAVGAQA